MSSRVHNSHSRTQPCPYVMSDVVINLDSLTRMYVCMYVCVYVCMYVCMYVCESVHRNLILCWWNLCRLLLLNENCVNSLHFVQIYQLSCYGIKNGYTFVCVPPMLKLRTYSTVSLYFLGVSLYIPTHMRLYSTLWSLSHVYFCYTRLPSKHLKSTVWSVIHVVLSCFVLWAELTVWNLLTRTRTDLTVAGKKIKWVLQQQHPVGSYTLGDGMWRVL